MITSIKMSGGNVSDMKTYKTALQANHIEEFFKKSGF